MCRELSSWDHTPKVVRSNMWASQPDRDSLVCSNSDGGGTWRGTQNTHLSSWSHQRRDLHSRVVHHGGPVVLEASLQWKRVSGLEEENSPVKWCQQLLPHACWWCWKQQGGSHQLPKASRTSFWQEHLLEGCFYQHPQILDTSKWLKVGLLPVDNQCPDLCTTGEPDPNAAEEGSSTWQWPSNHPDNEGASPSIGPTPKSEQRLGWTLMELGTDWNTGHKTGRRIPQDKTEDTAVIPDGQESESTSPFEIYWEHPVPLADRPQKKHYSLHLELCQYDEAVESRQIDDPPHHLLHKEQSVVESRTELVHRL